MKRLTIQRVALKVIALFVVLLAMGLHMLPTGSVACIELNGHIALESSANSCCFIFQVDGDGDGVPDPRAAEVNDLGCHHCIDVNLPQDPFLCGLAPTFFAAHLVSDVPPIAIINWDCSRKIVYRPSIVDIPRSPHLFLIESIIIQC